MPASTSHTRIFCLIAALTVAGASAARADVAPKPRLGLPNPAAVLCERNGARVESETLPNGSQKGVCVFPDGARIDEWAYFRNKHRTRN